jgi:hypothetical protein
MTPNLDDLYIVLRAWAVAKHNQTRTYTDLSQDYKARTGDWFEPHGSWDKPLGELNRRLHAAGAPALSALVIVGATKEPGGGFWGCSPNVPPRPKNEFARLTEWQRIVADVLAHNNWPAALP